MINSKSFIFDAFLCHNSKDKPHVKLLEIKLREKGVKCWFDNYELKPGNIWRTFVNSEWPTIASLVICFGNYGVSLGQQYEIDNLIPAASSFQQIIPILLPNVDINKDPKQIIPTSLQNRVWIDFRNNEIKSLESLYWGIYGENPYKIFSVGSYYRETEELEDKELLKCLNNIISKNIKIINYPKEVKEIVNKIFEDPENGDNIILFHNGAKVPKKNYGPPRKKEVYWNLDHIWPKSFGFPNNRNVNSDLHNIFPADYTYNARRSAGFFYDRRLDFTEKEVKVEPTRKFDPRGVIARACLYMATRYIGQNKEPKLELNERMHVRGEPHLGSLETLLYWNKLVDVDPTERKRNDMIAKIQGNRNPFIDNPKFADLIWYPV